MASSKFRLAMPLAALAILSACAVQRTETADETIVTPAPAPPSVIAPTIAGAPSPRTATTMTAVDGLGATPAVVAAQTTSTCRELATELSASIDRIIELDRAVGVVHGQTTSTTVTGLGGLTFATVGVSTYGDARGEAQAERARARALRERMIAARCPTVDIEAEVTARASRRG